MPWAGDRIDSLQEEVSFEGEGGLDRHHHEDGEDDREYA
jgi:hypothetical protein